MCIFKGEMLHQLKPPLVDVHSHFWCEADYVSACITQQWCSLRQPTTTFKGKKCMEKSKDAGLRHLQIIHTGYRNRFLFYCWNGDHNSAQSRSETCVVREADDARNLGMAPREARRFRLDMLASHMASREARGFRLYMLSITSRARSARTCLYLDLEEELWFRNSCIRLAVIENPSLEERILKIGSL